MNVTRTSVLTGRTHTMTLPIEQEEWEDYMSGALVQHAFPQLDSDGREFIISGITPEEWAEHMEGILSDEDDEVLVEGDLDDPHEWRYLKDDQAF